MVRSARAFEVWPVCVSSPGIPLSDTGYGLMKHQAISGFFVRGEVCWLCVNGWSREIIVVSCAGAEAPVVSRFMRKIVCRLRLNEVNRQ